MGTQAINNLLLHSLIVIRFVNYTIWIVPIVFSIQTTLSSINGGGLHIRLSFDRRSCYKLRTFPRPCCSRIAARFVLATSSANALSRKTTVLSPAGESFLCQSTIPRASASTPSRAIFLSRHAINVPAPTERTALPAMVRVSTGTQRSTPSLNSSS